MHTIYWKTHRRLFLLFITITLIALVGSAVLPAFAQELKIPQTQEEFDALTDAEKEELMNTLPPGAFSPAISANTPGAVNCFDYYSFGSVQVDAAPTLQQTIPGTTLTFAGTILNENPYPIVDGQVWMKIFKHSDTDEDLLKTNGDQLVAFMKVADKVVLTAGSESTPSEQPITFDWDVPSALGGGTYTAAYFFTTAYRYNLLGLTFTDDVTGNKATFEITALPDTTEPAHWNKNTVRLNDTSFAFAAFPPHFTQDESVTAHVELTNPSNETRVVKVTWITSKWDGILPQHKIKEETQGYKLAPKETKKIAYTPVVYGSSVTFLEAIAEDRDAKSIMHIRFVRDGNEEVRINFPSIMSYPLMAGQEATLFSCLHSTNLPVVSDNTLTLTLTDEKGNTVHTYTYTGDITGDMMGVKDTFTPSANLSTFSLTASLRHNGLLVDEVTQTYDCNEIDPNTCIGDTVTSSDTTTTPTFNTTLYTIVAALVILALLGLLVFLRRKREPSDLSVTTPEPYDKNI